MRISWLKEYKSNLPKPNMLELSKNKWDLYNNINNISKIPLGLTREILIRIDASQECVGGF
jgi:hypothetical protein